MKPNTIIRGSDFNDYGFNYIWMPLVDNCVDTGILEPNPDYDEVELTISVESAD